MGRRKARPIPGPRRRLLYSTGTVASIIGLGVALIASPAVAKIAAQHGPFARHVKQAGAEFTERPAQITDVPGPRDDPPGTPHGTTATGGPATSTTTSTPEPTASGTVTVPPTTTQGSVATGPTPTSTSQKCPDDAPVALTDYVAEHTDPLTRISCDQDVAVYYDEPLRQADPAGIGWITPFATEVWRYLQDSYGTCAADRDLAAPIGPNCERFGAPKPALFLLHQGTHSGGTVVTRFQSGSGYRTTIDVGYGRWDATDPQLRDVLVHEACHQVELGGEGTYGSPALGLWGDSKWAEFCVHDVYAGTGRDEDADRTEQTFLAARDDLPSGAVDAAWFRDWFRPLWQDGGDGPDLMRRYFELTARYFPVDPSTGSYSRGMTIGEYVLFTSAAAGQDLSGRAAAAFNSGFSEESFEQARKDFPELTF